MWIIRQAFTVQYLLASEEKQTERQAVAYWKGYLHATEDALHLSRKVMGFAPSTAMEYLISRLCIAKRQAGERKKVVYLP